jgi:hypothetical protein
MLPTLQLQHTSKILTLKADTVKKRTAQQNETNTNMELRAKLINAWNL